MARPRLRRDTNVAGDYFVDKSCIDCDACRLIAPETFARRGGQSAVVAQPADESELLRAGMALLTCPTASIGDDAKRSLLAAGLALPEPLDADVFRCGYASEKSFGAISYLVRRPEGNLLIDSPRFTLPLVRRIEELGGVSKMLLTHRDDVADHAQYRAHFGCSRLLHRDDVDVSTRDVETQPQGADAVEIQPGVVMIPVPGHTRGHVVFLVDDRWLFTGDHLAWNVRRETLYAFRDACWFSWQRQIESMERLLDYRF
jgi:ferredoxin